MKVNPKTLLFEDMTDQESFNLQVRLEKIVFDGMASFRDDPFFQMWREVAGFHSDAQALLVYATAYPQRALFSLIYHPGR